MEKVNLFDNMKDISTAESCELIGYLHLVDTVYGTSGLVRLRRVHRRELRKLWGGGGGYWRKTPKKENEKKRERNGNNKTGGGRLAASDSFVDRPVFTSSLLLLLQGAKTT